MVDFRNSPGKIWVVSDTHLKSGNILPDSFIKNVKREDIVIHLGDFVSLEIVARIEAKARLEAVSGNCDPGPIRSRFPRQKIIDIYGIKIGLTHGAGGRSETLQKARAMFEGKVEVALFGHTHTAHHSKSGGTLFFNPGSLTQSRNGPESFGQLCFDDGEIWGEVIEI